MKVDMKDWGEILSSRAKDTGQARKNANKVEIQINTSSKRQYMSKTYVLDEFVYP